MKKITTYIKHNKWVLLYLLLYFVFISLVVLNRWWQYEIYFFDHGIFDQSLWRVSNFLPPLFDHIDIFPLHQMGDHFMPSLYLLTPLYWFTDAYEPLLIIQNLFVIGSALVMYELSKKMFKSKIMSWALLVSFTWFVGLQNGLIAGFHTELLALFTLSLSFWFLEKGNYKRFWVFVLLTLGLKEVFVGIVFALGLYVLISKKMMKQGILLMLVAGLYWVFATKVMIPLFRGDVYLYTEGFSLNNILTGWFDSPLKIKTIMISLMSFGGLVVFGGASTFLLIQDIFIRFVIGKPASWDLGMHYSLMWSILLYFSSIMGVGWLMKKKWYKKSVKFHAILILFVSFGFHLYLHGPLGLGYNKSFYSHTKTMSFLDDFLNQIPNKDLIMTQNNMAVKLTHTHNVMLLRGDYWRFMPDVIAIDIRDGQNPNNSWPWSSQKIYVKLLDDPNYEENKYADEQVWFEKVDDVDMSYYDKKKS